MRNTSLLLALLLCVCASAAQAQSFTPAVNAKKQPSQAHIQACQEEYEASKIPQNGYKDFMKNCLKRKGMPAKP